MKNTGFYSTVFLLAGVFNVVVAFMLGVTSEWATVTLRLGTQGDDLILWLFAWLVFLFGLLYVWASRNIDSATIIVSVAALGKVGVFLIVLSKQLSVGVSKTLLTLATADLLFALCFVVFLVHNKSSKT